MLVVVDKVEPRNSAEEEGRVSALSGGDALEVGVQLALAVEGLSRLDLGDHLPHVHLDFSRVLGGAVESDYFCDGVSVQFHCGYPWQAQASELSLYMPREEEKKMRGRVSKNVRADRW